MAKEYLFLTLLVLYTICQGLESVNSTYVGDFLIKQRKILELFFLPARDDLRDTEFYKVGHDYDIESNIDLYTDKQTVEGFLQRFRLGMLQPDALFTIFNDEHALEVRFLFKLFNSAKDFEAFYKTACWARLRLNKGLFFSALYTVIPRRNDTDGIFVPNILELFPHVFFDHKIIQEAQRLRILSGNNKRLRSHVIDLNPASHVLDQKDFVERQLDYFTRDIALNNYYYHSRDLLPFWLSMDDSPKFKNINLELYYFLHQQLLARYKLERLSLGRAYIEDLDISTRIYPGYFSNLVFQNDVPVPSRDYYSSIPFYKNKEIKAIKKFEDRIISAIDSGYVLDKYGKMINIYAPNGLNILSNLIEGNLDSINPRYYGALEKLYRNLFGFDNGCKNKNCIVPSVLQTFTSCIRDPVYWRISKIITELFVAYKENVSDHTSQDIGFDGIIIEDVKVDRLTTYMDKCEYPLNNALIFDTLQENLEYNLTAKQDCLNHKPFSYNISVKSDRNVKGMVRIYLGPGVDECKGTNQNCLQKKWHEFVQLDVFPVDLIVGTNTVLRRDTDCIFCQREIVSSVATYKNVIRALENNSSYTPPKNFMGAPLRLVLPRGHTNGMHFKLFISITPIGEEKLIFVEPTGKEYLHDGKPYSFPLDRPLPPELMALQNIHLREVLIYHVESFENDTML